ncbi:N-formylglutamate amidohydrolase [Agrobacterium larrymoorei]|uniref:N-formylglutamate amidohydrolase n=1 Tax=Agrobacterium larrymoorei TaxID=160699 RepID=A0AAF0HCW3_9HYPH|nr:N-formylglutamate amidohydrolase [Agrobacterium larrymoorei]WHA42084.1 N-formylglutamate amidohydrolase [Agrobacterium larrymoorei]
MTVRSQFFSADEGDAVAVENEMGKHAVLLVCEHASRTLPARYGDLGLSDDVLSSHIAWDPGALAVARLLSAKLDATLIFQRFSRLIYDCNRPPESPSAMPVTSEIYDIPGNRNLSEAERFARTAALYIPFHEGIASLIEKRKITGVGTVIVTIHSFTPIYHGHSRAVEIGILHDSDSRLADEMLAAARGSLFKIERNEPYGPEDGVTHTLRLHALADGLLNVMIEVRNDLIQDGEGQRKAAAVLADLLEKGLASQRS